MMIATVLLAALASCDKGGLPQGKFGVSVTGQGPTSVSKKVNEEINDGLQVPRLSFQTRNPISLNVANKILTQGDQFTIINETTGATLVDRQPVPVLGAGLTDIDEFQAMRLTAVEITVRFFPLDGEMVGKFAYGTNKMSLLVDDASAERHSYTEVQLKDFDIMGLCGSAFSTDVQKIGGFQGWVNTLSTPVVTGGGTTLTVGMGTIINL